MKNVSNTLMSGLGGGVADSVNYNDYATIKSGGYGKLLKAYYNKDGDDSKEVTADKAASKIAETGVAYEKSEVKEDSAAKAPYSVNKMSAEDRKALVAQLKADQESRLNQMTELVSKMLGKQAGTYATANEMWELLSSGNFTVDAATKEQAAKDIEEDGYWGVKQTSQRLFDFASALAGDDVEKMQKMQKAMQKGFKMAEGTWGRELPDISKKTMDAANKLFDDYYASKNI